MGVPARERSCPWSRCNLGEGADGTVAIGTLIVPLCSAAPWSLMPPPNVNRRSNGFCRICLIAQEADYLDLCHAMYLYQEPQWPWWWCWRTSIFLPRLCFMLSSSSLRWTNWISDIPIVSNDYFQLVTVCVGSCAFPLRYWLLHIHFFGTVPQWHNPACSI